MGFPYLPKDVFNILADMIGDPIELMCGLGVVCKRFHHLIEKRHPICELRKYQSSGHKQRDLGAWLEIVCSHGWRRTFEYIAQFADRYDTWFVNSAVIYMIRYDRVEFLQHFYQTSVYKKWICKDLFPDLAMSVVKYKAKRIVSFFVQNLSHELSNFVTFFIHTQAWPDEDIEFVFEHIIVRNLCIFQNCYFEDSFTQKRFFELLTAYAKSLRCDICGEKATMPQYRGGEFIRWVCRLDCAVGDDDDTIRKRKRRRRYGLDPK